MGAEIPVSKDTIVLSNRQTTVVPRSLIPWRSDLQDHLIRTVEFLFVCRLRAHRKLIIKRLFNK
jgi:hypothetical protein